MNLSGLFFLLWGLILAGTAGLIALGALVFFVNRKQPPARDRGEVDFV